MKSELVIASHPREDILAARRSELAELTELLAEQELKLADLKGALLRFQRRYYQAIGSRYVELDELRARIARRRSVLAPEDEDFRREAWYRGFRADRSAADYRKLREEMDLEPPAPSPSDSDEAMKKLYRAIAVEVHPDRAEDEDSRAARTALMAELNAAYARGDAPRMQTILEEWRTSPEAIRGTGPAAELQRLARTITRVKKRISAVEAETDGLHASEMGRLLTACREAAVRGRDLLADLADELDRKIALAKHELEELS